jgi:hypothetical protein
MKSNRSELLPRLFFGRTGTVTKPRAFVWCVFRWIAWLPMRNGERPKGFSATWRMLKEIELRAKIEAMKEKANQGNN